MILVRIVTPAGGGRFALERVTAGHQEAIVMQRRSPATWFLILAAGVPFIGCHRGDPAERMIRMVDAMPPERQPPDWARTKALMSRRPPAVGEPAPDFTLPKLDGSGSITLSRFAADRPRVLIFGSFT